MISKELDKYIYFGFVIIASVLTNINIFKLTHNCQVQLQLKNTEKDDAGPHRSKKAICVHEFASFGVEMCTLEKVD